MTSLRSSSQVLAAAKAKARAAYGDSIGRDLAAAIDGLRHHPDRLEDCMRALQMNVPKALLWKRIRALERAGW